MSAVEKSVVWSKDPEIIARVLMGQLPKQAEDILMTAVVDSANKIRNAILQGLARDPHTGKVTRRGTGKFTKKGKKRYKTHTASAKGETPATDTGQLARSITYDVERGSLQVTLGVTAGAPYAIYLDENEENKSKWARHLITWHTDDQAGAIDKALTNAAQEIRDKLGKVF